ncbi:MAG: RluA family pseudouridine synthase [Christensenellales bacterium]
MDEYVFYPEKEERIDVYLAEKLGFTRSRIKNLIESGNVTYNGRTVDKCGVKLSKGEVIVTVEEPVQVTAEPQNLPVEIVYQDGDIAVINKAQGMVTHPCAGTPDGTLVNALMYHIRDLSAINGVLRPGIVHRLDKDTSGLLVVAKNNVAHLSLAEQIEKKTAGRYYVALVCGNIKEDEGTIDAPIARSVRDRKKMAVDENGRRAVTHYTVRERFGDYTLVEFKLETGRTHQIRVHAKYINHPVVGDVTYGKKDSFGLNGQLLHAYKLTLTHPTTGERMTFEADLPDYFKRVLDKLRKKGY